MASAATNEHSPLRPAEFQVLVSDDRAFDVRLVTSALDYFNRWESMPRCAPTSISHFALPAYGWLPGVLEERAKLAGIPASLVQFKDFGLVDAFDLRKLRSLSDGWINLKLLFESRVAFGRDREANLSYDGTLMSADEWFTHCLAPLVIQSKFVVDGARLRSMQVPILTTVESAVAYAIAVVLEDRWEVRERIRLCPYSRHARHYFLDYRVDGEGRFVAGESMKYCSKDHANAHRQQLWRDSRRKKK